jgi:hypothetical protein
MNQKGGTMVEAALVFPFIILSLMTIIVILMFLFEEAAAQAELHLVIRTEAGRLNGTFHGKTGSSSVSIVSSIKGIHRVMNGKSSITFEGTKIIPRGFIKPITGYQYLIDERKYSRYIDFFTQEEINDEDYKEKSVQ